MAGRLDQTEDGYMETIRRKTAALIATSCRLGGMLSEAASTHVDILERFGEALGMGFQLSDDIMDVISTERELGKEPGVDIKEGVYTLPVILALGESGELRSLLDAGPPDGPELARAVELASADGALAKARSAVTGEVTRAKELAAQLPEGSPRTALTHLAALPRAESLTFAELRQQYDRAERVFPTPTDVIVETGVARAQATFPAPHQFLEQDVFRRPS